MRKVTKLSGLRKTMFLNRGGAVQCSFGPTMPTIKESESFSSTKDHQQGNNKNQRNWPHNYTDNSTSHPDPSSSSSPPQTYTRRVAEAFVHLLSLAENHTYFYVAFPECHSTVCGGSDTVMDSTMAQESTCMELAETVSDDDSSGPGLNLNENGKGLSPLFYAT